MAEGSNGASALQAGASAARALLSTPVKAGIGGGVLFGMIVLVLFMAILGGGSNQTINYASLSDVEAQIASTMKANGFSNQSIAAVLGNLKAESGMDPASDENMDGMFNYAYERACGLFQYTSTSPGSGEYWDFKNWCTANGKQWSSATVQCEWTFSESGGGYFAGRWATGLAARGYYSNCPGYTDCGYDASGDEFKQETDVTKATYSWMACYERPANGSYAHLDRRLEYANEYLSKINSGQLASGSDSETVQRAYAELGKPYVWGACGPDSYDCSGLVGYALTGKHERIGTTATFMGWPEVSADQAQPGDIVTTANHCGVYIGNGQMIHAPHTNDVVKISDVQSGMKYVRYPG